MKKLLDEEEDELRIGSLPMQIPNYTDRTESETPLVQTPNTPGPQQHKVETPVSEGDDQICSPREPPIPSRNATHENRTPRYKVESENNVARRVKF